MLNIYRRWRCQYNNTKDIYICLSLLISVQERLRTASCRSQSPGRMSSTTILSRETSSTPTGTSPTRTSWANCGPQSSASRCWLLRSGQCWLTLCCEGWVHREDWRWPVCWPLRGSGGGPTLLLVWGVRQEQVHPLSSRSGHQNPGKRKYLNQSDPL